MSSTICRYVAKDPIGRDTYILANWYLGGLIFTRLNKFPYWHVQYVSPTGKFQTPRVY
jgi:hypothetical protein